MKTILVAVDFSETAYNAARFAIQLANDVKARVKLFHSFVVPLETPLAQQIAWPLEDYGTIKTDTQQQLEQMRDRLAEEIKINMFIDIDSEAGPLEEVLENIVNTEPVMLTIMGMSGEHGVDHFLFGSNTKLMINHTAFPLLLVPPHARYTPLQKIVFASDLHRQDSVPFSFLVYLAGFFEAELTVAHITHQKYDDPDVTEKIKSFMDMLSAETHYDKLKYEHIDSLDADHGLDWLAEHGSADMIAIVHRAHSLWYKIFEGSHTQKLARHIKLPLLVFPEY